MATNDILRRVAHALLHLASKMGCPHDELVEISTYLTQEDISQLVAARRERVSMAPDVLRRRGVVYTIRRVHRGVTCILPRIVAKFAARVMRSELSVREMEVLRLIVGGMSNKEIGATLQITEGTIKVHVSCLMKKLAAKGRTQAINLVLMHGIVDLESSN